MRELADEVGTEVSRAYPELARKAREIRWCVEEALQHEFVQKTLKYLASWRDAFAAIWRQIWAIVKKAMHDTVNIWKHAIAEIKKLLASLKDIIGPMWREIWEMIKKCEYVCMITHDGS